MTTRLQRLFSLEVQHGYYGGACGDVDFVVPQDTAWLLSRARLLARPIEGALHVFHCAAAGAGAPARSAAGRTVRLGLRVHSPSFANITEGFEPGAGALYYRNGSAADALDAPVRVEPVEPELRRAGVFGMVDIAMTPSFYECAPRFTLAFQARLETLRYYVVAMGLSNGDVDQLAVKDEGFGEPGHPDEVKFEKVPPERLTADEKSRTELLGSGGARVLLFRSRSGVARQQSGRKRIQLMRSSEPLIENLPQPGSGRGTADLIVFLSKSKT